MQRFMSTEGFAMVRNIVILLVVLAGLYLGYHFWQLHHPSATTEAQNGDYTCAGCMNSQQTAAFNKENPGGDDSSSATVPAMAPTGTSAVVPASRPSIFAKPAGTPTSTATASSLPSASTVAPSGPADSESSDAPNGVRFAGSGNYQWYRQGDVTYRIDTTTGKSCIIYATKREWRDPLVYNNGCGHAN
jgi:hypothetical protein